MFCPPAVLMCGEGTLSAGMCSGKQALSVTCNEVLRVVFLCRESVSCEPRGGCWRTSGLCLYSVPWEDRDGEPHPRGMQEGDSRGDGDTQCQAACFLPCLLMNTASYLSPGCFPSRGLCLPCAPVAL